MSSDPDAVKELIATGFFGTPLLIVGDQQVIGFRPDKLEAAFAKDHTA